MKTTHLNISIFFISLLISSCVSPVKTNILQSSFDVKQSKTNGVFVAEYIPSKNELNFKEQSFYIQQVWVEHYWMYKNIEGDIEMSDSKMGFVKFTDDADIFSINFIQYNVIKGVFFSIKKSETTYQWFRSLG